MTSPRPTEAAVVAALARIMAVSSAPAELLLGLLHEALGDPHGSRSAAVLTPSDGGRSWRVGAATSGFGRDGIEALARQVGPARASVAQPADVGTSFQGFVAEPVLDGTGSAVRLVASGVQVGVLVIQHCTPEQWAALSPSVAVGLAMCLTGGVVRQTSAEATAAALRSADAFRRLLEEGAHARDVEEAGAVVARAAAEAFQTELAGMYVVDQDTGLISFALGVGVPDELSRALSRSLVGKVAAASPVWQALEAGCPSLVDDAAGAAIRPGGFVQTLGFVSYAAIPLLSADGPLGMVICGEATTRRRWTQQEHDLARQFAMRGALVIDAARLRASERRQLARITFQAYHDGLTGIANRTLFIDRAEQALGVAARTGARVAMLMLDLDDFKQVNDTLGHGYGDTLLREVASRLSRLVPEADTVARLGGDEFAILMPSSAGPAEALALARTIEAALSDPIDLGGILLNTRASIGIAVSPDDGDDATDLMQRADIAMYASKRAGRGPTRYHCSQHDFTLDKLTLYTELRRAIAEDQLKMVYQPKLDLATGVIVGAEALVRWQHPRRGLIGPNEFLPVAESTDLIGDLTAWVTERALSQLADWHEQGLVIDVAINISARNLLDPALLAHVTRLIARSRLAHHLVLEITETAVMLDPAASADALSRFRELGVRVSLDDFGAGHSSLTQLAQLPADEIKIDRMLVHDVEREPLHAALVGSVADLGHRLGLTVVAEGIETAETLQAVRQLGCDIAQGYVISRPVEPEQFGSIAGIRRGAGRRTMRREDPVGPNGSCGRSGGRVSLVRCRRTASPVAPGPALP
ncbi:MAG: putative bifunctional diguanylate cyclase/phosphodiesterase [Jatrophihabitans sp.]|uniref:putative bifunctional diguanylate cyclase/phosphodiesterase n=1 Tax=Jatrophihabitans sp. TaxID=1932789 RepID=UPI003F7D4675